MITNENYNQGYENGYNKGFDDGVERGLNDVWKFMKKWHKMNGTECMEIFDCCSLGVLTEQYTPQEALAKLKEYEDAQIEVGDVVELLVGTKCVVTNVNNGGAEGITEHGTAFYNLPICGLKKTGKHIDIKAILEQIGE